MKLASTMASLARGTRGLLTTTLLTAAIGSSGCIKQMILDGQIEGTRQGAEAMNGTSDFEVARAASSAGLAQFEGMHALAPDNEDGYYLLIKGYASYAFGFVEDDMEAAYLEGKDDLGDYHKQRAKSLYTRAVGFGIDWMEKKHKGYADVAKTGNEKAMIEYLKKFDDKSDADLLFWIGNAWMSRANVTKEIELIGSLYVGQAMVGRALELNDTIENGTGHVVLGAYDARTGIATIGEESFARAKKHFDRATEISKGHALMVPLQYARSYVCRGKDDSPGRMASYAQYNKILADVIASQDPDPSERLVNSIAKRRALRYASAKYIHDTEREDCGWDLSAAPH